MLEKVRNKFKSKEEILKNKNSETTNLIGELLNDDACFLKINLDLALSILTFIGYPEEEAKDIYIKLMSESTNNAKGKYKLFDIND